MSVPKRSDKVSQEKNESAPNNGTNQGNKTENDSKKKKGPEAKRFNPDEKNDKPQKFKDGVRNGNEKLCKKRY